MSRVTGLTADRMLEIEGLSVVSGIVNAAGNLILTTHSGATIDAGRVLGLNGKDATALLGVTDTATVDLTLGGAGTTASPWSLSAAVKNIPASATNAGVFDLARIPNLTVTGVLEATYRGPGPAKVKLSGATTFTGPYKWLRPYVPSGSRTVTMRRDGGSATWLIESQDAGGKAAIVLASNWNTYNNLAASYQWSPPVAQLLSSGIVVLSGLVRVVSGVPANGSVVGTLPSGMWPDYDLVIGVNNSDTPKYITITAAGQINVGEGFVSGGYISLDGVAFPAKGIAQWTFADPEGTAGSDHTFANSWIDYVAGGGAYGRCRYWKDPYGFVWFGGMAKGGTTTDNTIIMNLPTTHRAHKRHHIATASYGAMGVLGGQPTTGIDYKIGTTSNSWVSLAGATLVTTDAFTKNPWRIWPAFANAWAVYDPSADQVFSDLRREDGLGMFAGLLSAGAVGSRIGYLQDENIPDRDILIQSVSNTTRARVDIGGRINTDKLMGSLFPQQGSNTWFSFDNIKYMV